MGLVKRTYTDNSTVITAQNLNDIQDSAIDSEVKITKLTPITGSTDPTTSTAGALKQIYLNTVNGKLFMCTAISGSTYTWTLIASGGGGGAATWGSIGGTMSNQVDLTTALDGKTEAFPVTISGSGSSMTADKTNEEIYEAVTAGKYVYIVTGSIATPYVCTSASIAEAYFVALEYVDPSHIYVMGYKIISDVVTEMNSQRLQTRINDDERLPAEYVSYDAGNTDVESALTSHATQLTNTSTQIANINAKIPTDATSSNQLADKAYVGTQIDEKENVGKITIGGVEKTASSHTVTIVTNGVTSTFTLVGVS